METLLQDVRYALRTLRRSRGFTAVAVITLALGIGANTAMFSIVNAVLLNPVSYPQPQLLLKLYTSTRQFRDGSVSYPNFLDWQRRSRSFELMAAYHPDIFNFTGQANPERVRGQMVSATMFPLLGIRPVIGRTFTTGEDHRGAAPVVVLTSNFWKTRFGGNPGVLGSSITLSGKLYTVIGVVPSDDVILRHVSVVMPVGQYSEPLFWDRSVGMSTRVLGRLKPGISPRQAQAELDSVAAGLAREYPRQDKDSGIYSVSLREDMVGDVRTPLLVLLAAVGFVLLIACANVANLLLARSSARRREFAVRGALGARPARIARQLLTEGLLLALAGGALGLGVAVWLNRLFAFRLASMLPRADQIRLDPAVLAFTAAISIVASLLFGITPALQSAHSDLNQTLKEAGRGTTSRHGLQRSLVVVEVALGLVLTASAGLMIRTMSRLWSVDPGFDLHHVLTCDVAGLPAAPGTPEAIRNALAATMRQMGSVPGVKAVSLAFGSLPMNGDSELPYWVEGRPKPAEQSQMDEALFYGVDRAYFTAMRIPLLRGRYVTAQDNENTACAVDIDQDLARHAFPGEDPIGQHLNLDVIPMRCEVVGIVGHVKHFGLDADALSKVHSQMYIPYRQFPDNVMNLASSDISYVVRTAGNPYSVVPALKRVVAAGNGQTVMFGEESMEDVIKDSLAARRFTRLLLGVFAGLALALAAVGIYGVISYSVTQNTHEIGLRMALGASRWTVLGMVLSSAMRLALVGIGVGAVTAFAAMRALKGMLFEVSAADPITFAAVALVLGMVTLIASYIPAWRAAKVDPMEALRYE